MHITWHGLSCVKLESGEVQILINPFQDSVGITMSRLKTSVALTSDPSDDTANNLQRLQGDPFIIENPGEYEAQNAFIYGIPAANNTSLFKIDMEGITVGHLGTSTPDLTDSQIEQLNSVDVLLIPLQTEDNKLITKAISAIEPRVIIPIQYQTPKVKTTLPTLDGFAKELGVTDMGAEKKVILKKKDLLVEGTVVHILSVS